MNTKYNQTTFIEEAKEVHKKDNYDLSKVVFKSVNEKITVICPEHGEFYPYAKRFIKGSGCRYCRYKERVYKNKRGRPPKYEYNNKNEIISIVEEKQNKNIFDFSEIIITEDKYIKNIKCNVCNTYFYKDFFILKKKKIQCPNCYKQKQQKTFRVHKKDIYEEYILKLDETYLFNTVVNNKYVSYIYSATNENNKKIYIGKTSMKIRKRIREHFNKYQYVESRLYSSICHHGWNKFNWKIIEIIQNDNKNEMFLELNKREIYWINYYKTDNPNFGYNMTIGGDGGETTKNTVWMNKERKNKMIKLERVDEYLEKGWTKGRVYNKKNKGNSIKVECIETKEQFDSIAECCRKYGLKDAYSVKRSCELGVKYKNYHFKFI